jgi:hypothetical protein
MTRKILHILSIPILLAAPAALAQTESTTAPAPEAQSVVDKNIVVGDTGANTDKRIFDKSDFADGNLFVDATPSVRFGLEYAWFRQTDLDGVKNTNHRVQLSGFYIF